MKTVLFTAIMAAVSPIAIAQNSAAVSGTKTVTADQLQTMTGSAVSAPLPNEIETSIMNDALEQKLQGDVHSSAIEGARRAYVQTMFKPIWTERGAESLRDASSNLFEFGLTKGEVLEANLDGIIKQRFDAGSEAEQAEADLALTAAWIRVAAAVSGGLSDEGQASEPEKDAATYAMLPEMLIDAGKGAAKDALKTLEPVSPQYVALKGSLQEYREIREAGGWLAIPDGDVVETGASDPRIPAIRERLAAEGYKSNRSILTFVSTAMDAVEGSESPAKETAAAASNLQALDLDGVKEAFDPTLYDEQLVSAVKVFQQRHGIEPDGVIGPATLAAMNESVDSKIARIADSMDRWRVQGDIGDRFIWANVPSYSAEGWNNGAREIAMRTIVGKKQHATPSFSDEVEYAVANPRWYAPVSIVRNEKAPKLAKDPGYAQRGNYRVYDRASGAEVSASAVDWTAPDVAEKYRLVQMSGSNNALGELKIIFPNQYSIYLHGTPGKHLFDRAERAFSHGCIRLEKPTEMAEWLARQDGMANPGEVEEAVISKARKKFDFQQRVPIHITYMTVTVDDEGKASFWRDIYDRTDGIREVEKFAPLYQADDALQTASLEAG